MSTYPLDEPHLAALRNVCKRAADPKAFAHWMALGEAGTPEEHEIARRITRPASAASLTRDLLARADVNGVALCATLDDASISSAAVVIYAAKFGLEIWTSTYHRWAMPDVPRLIFALASLAPSDRDGAMRAMREASS